MKNVFDDETIETISYFISQSYIFPQPELVVGQKTESIHVPKEHIRQWIVQALGVSPVGAGSYAVDVIKKNEWGADIKYFLVHR